MHCDEEAGPAYITVTLFSVQVRDILDRQTFHQIYTFLKRPLPEIKLHGLSSLARSLLLAEKVQGSAGVPWAQ